MLSRAELIARYGRPRDKPLVFTNGCFELLHPGHVTYLAAARALGGQLVVAVNTDDSARRLGKSERRLAKSDDRPFVGERDRAVVVAALDSVDAVCLFDEDTPRELIAELLPDVLVKGGDYALAAVVGGRTRTARSPSRPVSHRMRRDRASSLLAPRASSVQPPSSRACPGGARAAVPDG